MAPPFQVKAEGLRELNRDLGRIDKSLQRGLQKELRAVSEPIAAVAREKARALGLRDKIVAGIRAGSSQGHAVIRQAQRRTTGLHPEFGALQMREVLVPAADEGSEVIEIALGVMIERIALGNGFFP